MTTWLKKLRLYLLRRQLKAVRLKMFRLEIRKHPLVWMVFCDTRADLVDRIAEIEKTL